MAEILFLGTGAADWEIEKRNGFFRRNSAALLNGEFMFDCGEHIFDFALHYGNENLYENVSDIVITHNHYDHFNKDSVLKIAQNQKIRVGASKEIADIIDNHPNIEFVIFTPYEKAVMGKYEVTPLLANHQVISDGDIKAYNYIVKTPDNKTMFYGLDGAWFLRPSWEEIKKYKFDAMIFDCTIGDRPTGNQFEHNSIPMLKIMLGGIKIHELISDKTLLIASHLARTLHVSHEETEEILKSLGMITAFDGLKLTF